MARPGWGGGDEEIGFDLVLCDGAAGSYAKSSMKTGCGICCGAAIGGESTAARSSNVKSSSRSRRGSGGLPVIRIAPDADVFVRLVFDKFERAGANRMAAHVALRDMARVTGDWPEASNAIR